MPGFTFHHAMLSYVSSITEDRQWEQTEFEAERHPSYMRNKNVNYKLQPTDDYMMDPAVKVIDIVAQFTKPHRLDCMAAALFDEELRLLDIVSLRQKTRRVNGVRHRRRRLRIENKKGNDIIRVDTSQVPHNVHYIALMMCAQRTSTVPEKEITVNLVERTHRTTCGNTLCHFSLPQMTAGLFLLGQMTRVGGYWNFRVANASQIGEEISDTYNNTMLRDYLSRYPSHPTDTKRISLSVTGAKDLSIKDRARFIKREDSMNVYYVITYGNKRIVSERDADAFTPRWESKFLKLGEVAVTETSPVTVRIFNRDFFGADVFLGEITIPASALFRVGLGEHSYKAMLSSSSKKRFKREDVSGSVHFTVRIEEN